MSSAIALTGVSKDYGGEHALGDVSFGVRRGALFGLIGADGAGKSTLMRIAVTLLDPDRGEVRVLSRDTRAQRREIRAAVGYMPQRFSLYEDLTVGENMRFFADIFGIAGSERTERFKRLLRFSRLGPFQNRRAGNLSGGMKQKLALSCALIHTPELVVLDEPTTGVDPLSRREFWDILREIRSRGVTVFVSTPYMEEAEYCSDLALLHGGRLLRSGTPSEMADSYPLRLYRLSAGASTLHYPQSAPRPPGIDLLYPSRGGLQAAVTDESMDEDRVRRSVREYVPEVENVQRVKPRIEDVFFYELTRNGPPKRVHAGGA